MFGSIPRTPAFEAWDPHLRTPVEKTQEFLKIEINLYEEKWISWYGKS